MLDIVDVKDAVQKGEVKAYVKDNIIYLTYCNTEETVMIGEADHNQIAEELKEKMMYMGTCLNERDIILDIILGKRIPRDLHCNTDCKNDECKLYKNLEIKKS